MTRWRDTADGNRALQFVCATQADGQRSIPGGLAEFDKDADPALLDLFAAGVEIYTGYVDDPRNTDNAWIETTVLHVHDDMGTVFSTFPLLAGPVFWLDITDNMSELYASHRVFVAAAAARVTSYP